MKSKICMKASSYVVVLMILGAFLVVNLDSMPIPSFDEGWALSVARNWVQFGHYGQLLNGRPISASMLNIGFPAIVPMAAAFRILGIGFYQGRLPIVIFTLGAFFLLYWLSRRLYDNRVALGTIVFLIFLLPVVSWIHPLLMGRQAIGEMPSMFYLLAGYVCFFLAFNKSFWFAVGCSIFWGLASVTKIQGLPFLLAALFIVLFLSLIKRNWKTARLLAGVTVCSMLSYVLFRHVQNLLLKDEMLRQMSSGLLATTAIVPALAARLRSAIAILTAGLPTLSAIIWKGRKWQILCESDDDDLGINTVKSVMWIHIAIWLAWYILLSVGWPRYLFPPVFLSSIFVAASAAELTSGFRILAFLQILKKRLNVIPGVLFSLIILLHVASICFSLNALNSIASGKSVREVTEFLNQRAETDPLVETYEMELFVLLDVHYHYPPDEVQIQLNRRVFLRQNVEIDYNILRLKPDFLVIGPQARLWKLYDEVLQNGYFFLIKRIGPYEIYQRTKKGNTLITAYVVTPEGFNRVGSNPMAANKCGAKARPASERV